MVATIILPGLLIYLVYSLMGNAFSDNAGEGGEGEAVYRVQAVHMSETVYAMIALSDAPMEIYACPDCDELHDTESMAESLQSGAMDLFVAFPENFDALVAAYDPASGQAAPEVQIYYDSTSQSSTAAYTMMTAVLDGFESTMANRFDINRTADVTYDLASEEDITGMVFSMLMPMLLVMLTFSGCMAVAPESIAGEKERGTIASMLITPTKRSHIAIGKILALALVALMSGASSTIGIIASLPKLMQMDDLHISGDIYGVTDYVLLSAIVLSTALLFVTIISVISAYAKSVKEAASMVSPLMILVMVVGISGMFKTGELQSIFYLIPVYNSVQSIVGIFSLNTNIVNILITIGANALFTAGGIFLLTKMFDNEKIMFNK